jgi:hypothetical protein
VEHGITSFSIERAGPRSEVCSRWFDRLSNGEHGPLGSANAAKGSALRRLGRRLNGPRR